MSGRVRWMRYLVVEEDDEGVDEVGGVGQAGEGPQGGQGQHLHSEHGQGTQ